MAYFSGGGSGPCPLKGCTLTLTQYLNTLPTQIHLAHFLQVIHVPFPFGAHAGEQFPELGAVVMFHEVAEFVAQYGINASCGGFDQVRINAQAALRRARSPARLHFEVFCFGQFSHPWHGRREDFEPRVYHGLGANAIPTV